MRPEKVLQAEKTFRKAVEKTGEKAVIGQVEKLHKEMLEMNFTMKGKPFPTFLKPYIIEKPMKKVMTRATEVIMNCVEKVGDLFFSDPKYESYFQMNPLDLELAKINPRYPRRVINARLDAFLSYGPDGHDLKFLEFNCDSPCGMGWHDQLIGMLPKIPVFADFHKSAKGHMDEIVPSLLKGLRTKNREYGNPENGPMAVLCWEDSSVRYDLGLVADYMKKLGQDAIWADNRDCSYDGKTLKMAGKPVGLCFRDAIQEFTEDMVKTKPILDAYKDGKVCLVNPFSSRVGGLKCVLWFMTDPISAHLFNAEEKEVIAKTIPWTRFMHQGPTDYKGKQVDLFEFVRKSRENMVLKPNAGYGGFDVTIGKETDAKRWDQVLEQCAKAPWVVQEFVAIPNEEFPRVTPDGIKWEPKNANINFFAHNGKFGGGIVRVSDSSIINVHQGGGMVPIYYV